eukprot:359252-Chlamydomonas_euryale.AAC.3
MAFGVESNQNSGPRSSGRPPRVTPSRIPLAFRSGVGTAPATSASTRQLDSVSTAPAAGAVPGHGAALGGTPTSTPAMTTVAQRSKAKKKRGEPAPRKSSGSGAPTAIAAKLPPSAREFGAGSLGQPGLRQVVRGDPNSPALRRSTPVLVTTTMGLRRAARHASAGGTIAVVCVGHWGRCRSLLRSARPRTYTDTTPPSGGDQGMSAGLATGFC